MQEVFLVLFVVYIIQKHFSILFSPTSKYTFVESLSMVLFSSQDYVITMKNFYFRYLWLLILYFHFTNTRADATHEFETNDLAKVSLSCLPQIIVSSYHRIIVSSYHFLWELVAGYAYTYKFIYIHSIH